MTQAVDAKGAWLAEFARLEKRLPAFAGRRDAIARFEAAGFPGPDDEAWRFTDISPIVDTEFRAAPAPSRDDLAGVTDGPLRGSQVVFFDGQAEGALPVVPGLELRSLSDPAALRETEAFLGRLADPSRPFVALNSALWSDGVFVRIPKRAVLERPLHLLFISTAAADPTAVHPRVVIVAEEGSQASIVESYVGVGAGRRLTNAVTEVFVGAGASLDHHRLQREDRDAFHLGSVFVRQERDSRFVSRVISVGAAIARTEITATLDGNGADCTLQGLYEAAGRQVADHQTTIDHAKPHGTSRELYKGILDGEARGVFNGRILVRKDAQKTDAVQSNKNLLLSDAALVHTKPQLEILANDVKCKHGATVGQLDRNVLFYLRSRGIGVDEARRLLVHAFASEIADEIRDDAIRAQLAGCLMTMVRGGGRLEV